MKAFTFILSAALFIGHALGQMTINTPTNVVVCEPILLTWSGGVAPYFLSILPGSDPSGAALEQFSSLQGTSLTWTVNIAAGTSIGLTLKDSTGVTASSAAFTIDSGPSTSCLTASSGATSATGSTPAASGATSVAGTTTAATSPLTTLTTPVTTGTATTIHPASSGSTVASASHSSSASAATQSTGAGATNLAAGGAAAVVGAVVAAILA